MRRCSEAVRTIDDRSRNDAIVASECRAVASLVVNWYLQMAAVPTPEESARVILDIFKAHSCRPGQTLKGNVVKSAFLKAGGMPDGYGAALRYAEAQGWLAPVSVTGIKLTDAGFSAM